MMTPEQEKTMHQEQMWNSMLRNDEQWKEHLDHLLQDVLRCARLKNWMGMEHCLHLYAQAESKRLNARAGIMEKFAIELYRAPHTDREYSLFNELFQLLRTFLLSAEQTHTHLVEQFHRCPDGPHEHDIHFFRQTYELCLNVYQWLASRGTAESEEKAA